MTRGPVRHRDADPGHRRARAGSDRAAGRGAAGLPARPARARLAGCIVVLTCYACRNTEAPAPGGGVRFVAAPGSPHRLGEGIGRPVLADLNTDGILDVVVPFDADAAPEAGPGRVAVLSGTGNGDFELTSVIALPAGHSKLAVGDVDEDGHLDVAAASHDSYVVRVLLGDGAGGLGAPDLAVVTRTGRMPHTHSVVLADVDLDGHLDLLTTNAGHGDVSVLLGDGGGHFEPAAASPVPAGVHPYEGMVVRDLDGDRYPDIVVPDLYGNAVVALLGDGTGTFAPMPGSPAPVARRPGSVEVGDVDGDGSLDVLATHDDDPLLTVLERRGSRLVAHSESPLRLLDRGWDACVADFDGDGTNDVLLGGVETDLLLRLHAAGPSLASGWERIADVGSGPGYLAVGDLDGDGLLDIVTANFSGGDVSVLLARRRDGRGDPPAGEAGKR